MNASQSIVGRLSNGKRFGWFVAGFSNGDNQNRQDSFSGYLLGRLLLAMGVQALRVVVLPVSRLRLLWGVWGVLILLAEIALTVGRWPVCWLVAGLVAGGRSGGRWAFWWPLGVLVAVAELPLFVGILQIRFNTFNAIDSGVGRPAHNSNGAGSGDPRTTEVGGKCGGGRLAHDDLFFLWPMVYSLRPFSRRE